MNLARLDRRWAVSLFIAILLIMFSVQSGYAQSGAFAAITGRVLDPKEATVPNATVTAKNVETGLTRTIKTTTEGLYRFEDLRPGVYEVSMESPSFSRKEVSNVKLLVGDQLDVNFDLEVAGQTQSVVITAEAPLIETTKTDISMVIDDKAVSALPTTTSFNSLGGVANDYEGLAASAPGVKFDYSGDSSDIVGPGAVSDRGVMVNIDGGNISDEVYSWRDALGASLEEVKEFQVLTNNYNAEYGQASNVILNVVTKSGTNSIHGIERSGIDAVRCAIERLPAIFREVILLCDVEDASYREIAEILSIPMGTVMSRLARARKALRESLLSALGAPLSRDLSHHIETHEDPGATREVSIDQDFAAEEDKLLPLSSRIWRSNPAEPF